jgi:hypothetical protein
MMAIEDPRTFYLALSEPAPRRLYRRDVAPPSLQQVEEDIALAVKQARAEQFVTLSLDNDHLTAILKLQGLSDQVSIRMQDNTLMASFSLPLDELGGQDFDSRYLNGSLGCTPGRLHRNMLSE